MSAPTPQHVLRQVFSAFDRGDWTISLDRRFLDLLKVIQASRIAPVAFRDGNNI